MEAQLTREELIKQAERLYVEAALMLTRLKPKMKKGVVLVLVEKMSYGAAAKAVRRPKQNVVRAVQKVRPLLERVKASAQQPTSG